MALTFPSAALFLASNLRQQDWRLTRRDQMSRQANGIVRVATLGQPLWAASVVTMPMPVDDALEYEAIVNSHNGGQHPLYWGDLRRVFPKAHPVGASFSDTGAIATVPTATSITLKTLPANFQISVGDYFHFSASGGRRSLHQAVEAVQADGSGDTAAFEVRPPLPSFAVADVAVSFKNPRAKMIIVPNSLSVSTSGAFTEIGFDLLQTY